jgi:hypothetical protein
MHTARHPTEFGTLDLSARHLGRWVYNEGLDLYGDLPGGRFVEAQMCDYIISAVTRNTLDTAIPDEDLTDAGPRWAGGIRGRIIRVLCP